MNDAKLTVLKSKIDDGESDTIAWADLFKEFTDLKDARQLAVLKLLSPGKLGLLVKLINEALPLSQAKTLESFKLRMSQEGIDFNQFVTYISTGVIEAPKLPNQNEENRSISNNSQIETTVRKQKRTYSSAKEIARRREIMKEIYKNGGTTGDCIEELDRVGLLLSKNAVYSDAAHIKNLAKRELEAEAKAKLEPQERKTINENELAELTGHPNSLINDAPEQPQTINEASSNTTATQTEENATSEQTEPPFFQEEPTAHYAPDNEDEEIKEAEKEFSAKLKSGHAYY